MNKKSLKIIAGFIVFTGIVFASWKIYSYYHTPEFSNGDIIPDIRLPNQINDTISLYSLKGNIVLVQFWASWCGPCRFENRELLNLYSKFQNLEMKEGGTFKIFSISVDKDKSSWKKAVEQDKMFWPDHVNDSLDFEKSISKKFNVHSVPSTFLIDQKEMVIGVNLSPMQLEGVLTKRLK